MRILVTAYDYRPRLGGVATAGHELARALSRLPGAEVRVIAREVDREADAASDLAGGLDVLRVALPDRAPAAAWKLALVLRGQCREWRPDAILNLLWLPCGVASLAGAGRVPYFVVAHGVEVLESSATLRKRLRQALTPLKRRVFGRARRVFAVSRFTAEQVRERCGVPAGRVRVNPNGVNPEEFFARGPDAPEVAAIRARYGAEGRVVFMTVTRLDDYKGVDMAIRSMARVVREEPRALYVVCGTGGDRPRLEKLVEDLGLREHVRFAGAVPFSELNDHYNACDAHVLLSRSDWEAPNVEGFGLVFLEAAACGKPSIAGDSGGIPDAVERDVTGWLVPPTDEEAIARAMLECARDGAKRRRLGEAALQRALGSLTWAHSARRILDSMRECGVGSREPEDVRD